MKRVNRIYKSDKIIKTIFSIKKFCTHNFYAPQRLMFQNDMKKIPLPFPPLKKGARALPTFYFNYVRPSPQKGAREYYASLHKGGGTNVPEGFPTLRNRTGTAPCPFLPLLKKGGNLLHHFFTPALHSFELHKKDPLI